MASRRDELNAYSFARRRTVASFLKPLPNGSVESAPRPMRTVLPSVLLGTLILVGFGACGLIKPVAPQGWNAPGEKVIVGDESTTRYVVLCGVETKEGEECPKGKSLLHPVLNLASARLVLNAKSNEVVKVKESVLDGPSAPKHGPLIGIPYAPDRLPDPDDAKTKKTWMLCERPGGNERSKAQRAVFVLSESDKNRKKLVDPGKGRLNKRTSMFVEDEAGRQYLVDDRGVAFPLNASAAAEATGVTVPAAEKERQNNLLRSILYGDTAEPQKVTQEWMATLIKSPVPIFLPPLPGAGGPSSAEGVPEEHRTIGKVLEANGQHYLVESDGVSAVSDFVAKLLLEGPVGSEAYPDGNPQAVALGQASVTADKEPFMAKVMGPKGAWPQKVTSQTNTFDGNKTICSVWYGANKEAAPGFSTDYPDMSMWAGKSYPVPIADGASSAYVTPGSGLLYTEAQGKSKDGFLFLVTDTGLRYSVQRNNDTGTAAGNAEKDQDQAKLRLGYGNISSQPVVPEAWSKLLSAGPSLNTDDAKQPQGS
ncbi:type VII secretion protein EccB [Streptomyces sp. 8N706]|uniref:type VII secretion protein EccB n=1 Tax=Streptomyces sp. 8N706 TaxID=3457416 RepID=UPI003FD5FFD6